MDLLADRRSLGSAIKKQRTTRPRWILGGAAGGVVILNGLLNPFASSNGTMQTGLVGLGLAGLLVLIAKVETTLPSQHRRAIIATAIFGFVPWFFLNAGVSAGSHLSSSFREKFLNGSEGDWSRIAANDLSPLGLSHPLLQLLCVAALACYLLFQGIRRPLTINR